MGKLLFIILITVAIVYMKKNRDKKKVEAGDYDRVVLSLEGYYGVTRDNLNALGTSIISISTYWFETDGKVDTSSGAMSVCVQDGTNDNLADSLGMKVAVLEGKKHYQFMVPGRFSRTVKCEILKKLAVKLSNDYPNDLINMNESIPALYSMVDMKDTYEMLNRVNKER